MDGEEGEYELALELLLMLARYGVLISGNNNIGQGRPWLGR